MIVKLLLIYKLWAISSELGIRQRLSVFHYVLRPLDDVGHALKMGYLLGIKDVGARNRPSPGKNRLFLLLYMGLGLYLVD